MTFSRPILPLSVALILMSLVSACGKPLTPSDLSQLADRFETLADEINSDFRSGETKKATKKIKKISTLVEGTLELQFKSEQGCENWESTARQDEVIRTQFLHSLERIVTTYIAVHYRDFTYNRAFLEYLERNDPRLGRKILQFVSFEKMKRNFQSKLDSKNFVFTTRCGKQGFQGTGTIFASGRYPTSVEALAVGVQSLLSIRFQSEVDQWETTLD